MVHVNGTDMVMAMAVEVSKLKEEDNLAGLCPLCGIYGFISEYKYNKAATELASLARESAASPLMRGPLPR